MPEGPHYYPEGVVSDQPEAFLAAELLREQLLRRPHDELPHSIMVTTDEIEERDHRRTGPLLAFAPGLRRARLAEGHRDRQGRRALLKQGGHRGPRSSSKRCSASRVHLETHVRVDRDWQRRAAVARPTRL